MASGLTSVDPAIELSAANGPARMSHGPHVAAANVGSISRVFAAITRLFREKHGAGRTTARVTLQDARMRTIRTDNGTRFPARKGCLTRDCGILSSAAEAAVARQRRLCVRRLTAGTAPVKRFRRRLGLRRVLLDPLVHALQVKQLETRRARPHGLKELNLGHTNHTLVPLANLVTNSIPQCIGLRSRLFSPRTTPARTRGLSGFLRWLICHLNVFLAKVRLLSE